MSHAPEMPQATVDSITEVQPPSIPQDGDINPAEQRPGRTSQESSRDLDLSTSKSTNTNGVISSLQLQSAMLVPTGPAQQESAQTSDPVVPASLTRRAQRKTVPQARIEYDATGKTVHYRDPNTEITANYRIAPPNEISDPELLQQGITAHSLILGTDGEVEKYFKDFRKREQSFFTQGRVFKVLWAEPADSHSTITITNLEPPTSVGRYGERVFAKVRTFVVVRQGELYCSALPIVTHSLRGVSKPGIKKSEHGIIYTGKEPPKPLPAEAPKRGEKGMLPDSIKVNPESPMEKLDEMSRIDYGKVHSVEYTVKVRSFGSVNDRSMNALLHQFRNVWLESGEQHDSVHGIFDSTVSHSHAGTEPSRHENGKVGRLSGSWSTSSRRSARSQLITTKEDEEGHVDDTALPTEHIPIGTAPLQTFQSDEEQLPRNSASLINISEIAKSATPGSGRSRDRRKQASSRGRQSAPRSSVSSVPPTAEPSEQFKVFPDETAHDGYQMSAIPSTGIVGNSQPLRLSEDHERSLLTAMPDVNAQPTEMPSLSDISAKQPNMQPAAKRSRRKFHGNRKQNKIRAPYQPKTEDWGHASTIDYLTRATASQPEIVNGKDADQVQQDYLRTIAQRFVASSAEGSGGQKGIVSMAASHSVGPETEPASVAGQFGNQLRHLRKQTDDVLLKRTQYLNERSKLQAAQRYLRESTDKVMVAMSARFLTAQNATMNTNPVDPHPLGNSNSDKGAVPVEHAVENSRGLVGQDSDINVLFDSYVKDYEVLHMLESSVMTHMEQLSNMEYQLAERVALVNSQMKKGFSFIDELRFEMIHGEPDSSESGSQTRTESDIPDIVNRYFDRKGDVGVFQERLQELEFTHDEGRMERNFVRDRGDVPGTSDEEFEMNYQARRQNILDQIDLAKTQAEELAELCRQRNYDIDSYRVTERTVDTEGPKTPHSESDSQQDPPQIHELAMPGPTTSSLAKPSSMSIEIDTWLHRVSALPGEPEVSIADSAEERSVRSEMVDDSPFLDSVEPSEQKAHVPFKDVADNSELSPFQTTVSPQR